MERHTVILVMTLCVMGIITCILWGERDAERDIRFSAEQRLAETQEKLGAAEDARKTAEEAWLVEKASWKAALEDVTRERDALLSNTFCAGDVYGHTRGFDTIKRLTFSPK